MKNTLTLNFRRAAVLFGLFGMASGSLCSAAVLSAPTAIPVQLTHGLQANHAKSGDVVTAKTMQVVVLPDGKTIPKGSLVVGHIVAARAFVFDPTPYAVQKPSSISVHFDKIVDRDRSFSVAVAVRALAAAYTADRARLPQYRDDTSIVPFKVQICGGEYSPYVERVSSAEGNIVAYNRPQGIFARLISNDYVSDRGSFHCDATSTEQSVAIFSAKACGLYGFDEFAYLLESGKENGGTFTVESFGYNLQLGAGSAVLLEAIDSDSHAAVPMLNN